MARNKNREWQVGDFVTIYSQARRRHGIIKDKSIQYGEWRYEVLVFSYCSPYFSEKWQVHEPYILYRVDHKHILSKMRKHTTVKYKLMGYAEWKR